MPAGRPSKLREEFLCKIPELIRAGASQNQIAAIFGVDQSVVSRWIKNNPKFYITWNYEKALADGKIEDAVYRRALGVTTRETRTKEDSDGNVETVHIEREHAPDVEAAKFWLSNRRPESWKVTQPELEMNASPIQVVVNIPRPGNKEETIIAEALPLIPRPELKSSNK